MHTDKVLNTTPSSSSGTLSPERQLLLDAVIARLSVYNPERVILFGSFARNESDEASDIDLVIIKSTEDDFFTRIRKVMRLLDLRTSMDILVYTPDEFEKMKSNGNAFIETIVEEGIVLHG
jgi:uncharacterized protein